MTSRSVSTETAADVIGGNDASWKNGNCRRQMSGRNTFTTTAKCNKVGGCGRQTRKSVHKRAHNKRHRHIQPCTTHVRCCDARTRLAFKKLWPLRTCSMELKQCRALQALSRVKGHSTADKARYKTVTLNTSTLG